MEDEVAPQQPYDVVGHRQPEKGKSKMMKSKTSSTVNKNQRCIPDESLSGKGKVGLAERHQRVHQVWDDPLLSQCHYEMCQKYHLQKHSDILFLEFLRKCGGSGTSQILRIRKNFLILQVLG